MTTTSGTDEIQELQAVADARQRFIDASIELDRDPRVRATRSAFDCRNYEGRTTLEFYLEADLPGRTVCWSLDAYWRENSWVLESCVLVNRDHQEQQDTLQSFPDREAATLSEALRLATEDLLNTTTNGEFLAPDV